MMKKYLAGPLSPHVVYKIWGGSKLAKLRSLKSSGEDGIGETWDISILATGPSRYEGTLLSEYLSGAELPYLVKTIDTSEELSVQVHPGDEYAALHENSLGKTESWLVVAAGEGAGIYLGMRPNVTREAFFAALKRGEDMSLYLNFYPVKGGEFFYVPAGSIHAIGKNVTLLEVQQSSGVTYRVWDWNRLDSSGKGRELHIERAGDVINFDPEANRKEFFNFKEGLFDAHWGVQKLVNHPQFSFSLVRLRKGEEVTFNSTYNRARSLLMIEGVGPEFELGKERGVVERRDGYIFHDRKEESPLNLKARDDCTFIVVC